MNLDDDSRFLKENEHREIWNSMISVGEGSIGRLNKHIGTTNVFTLPINSGFALPTGTFTCIGTCDDIETGSIIYAICDKTTTNHGFFRMFIEGYRLEWILKSQPYLNFKEDYPVSMDVINGLLYFTDGYFTSFLNNDFNPERKINIEKAVKFTDKYSTRWEYIFVGEGNYVTHLSAYTNKVVFMSHSSHGYSVGDRVVSWCPEGEFTECRYKPFTALANVLYTYSQGGYYYIVTDLVWNPIIYGQHTGAVLPQIMSKSGYMISYETDMYFGIDWQVLDVIKWKPQNEPSASYSTDLTRKINRLQNKLFQFNYRWIFDDNEKSVCSPISKLPIPDTTEMINGAFDPDIISDNVINVWANTGSMEVKTIEIFAREGNIGVWKLVKRINKFDENGNPLIGYGLNDINVLFEFYNDEVAIGTDQVDIRRPYDFVPIVAKQQKIIEKNRLLYSNYKEGFNHVDVDVTLSTHQIERSLDYGMAITLTPTVRNVRWYKNSPNLYYQDFTCLILHMENVPIIVNKTYKFDISAPTYQLHQGVPGNWQYPPENNDDWIVASAIVSLDAGESLKDLMNKICLALRSYGTNIDYSALACTGSHYKSYNNHLWDSWEGQSTNNIIYEDEIGIVFGQIGTGNLDISKVKISFYLQDQTVKYRSFKSGEMVEVGIEYCERGGRNTFVNEKEGCSIYIPHQSEFPTHQIYQNIIKWEISHIPPPEALCYRWVMRKRVSLPYYIQCPLYNIGLSEIEGSVSGSFLALSVIKNFLVTKEHYNKFNIKSYVWQRGDRVRFLFKGQTDTNGIETFYSFTDSLDFEIISIETPLDTPGGGGTYQKNDLGDYILDQAGNKIKDPEQTRLIIPYFNYIGFGISSDSPYSEKIIIEIYRPGKRIESDTYYQLSPSIPILYPHTAQRTHSFGDAGSVVGWDRDQTSSLSARGTIETGDCYLIPRLMENDAFSVVFPCESMSYSDWYDSDDLCIGLENIENKNTQCQDFVSNLRYSGILIQDTLINELSKFIGSDFFSLPDKYGSINHIEEVGFTLKILQTSKPSSIYIGRAGVTQPSAESKEILSSTKDVLGTLIIPESGYGTSHPTSVCKFERQLYFYDIYSGDILRDSGNGIQSLSKDYKIDAFIKAKSILFLQSGVENVKVTSCYDHKNNVMFMTFIDSITPANSFTIGFRNSTRQEEEGFISFYQFKPDFYGVLKQTMTAFYNETLWIHNLGDVCNFYGTKYIASVKIVSNKEPIIVKRFLTIAQSGTKVWDSPTEGDITIPITDTYQRGAMSLLKAGRYVKREGKFVSDFMKNMVTSSIIPKVSELITGDDLRGQVLEMTLYNNDDGVVELFAIEINAVESK